MRSILYQLLCLCNEKVDRLFGLYLKRNVSKQVSFILLSRDMQLLVKNLQDPAFWVTFWNTLPYRKLNLYSFVETPMRAWRGAISKSSPIFMYLSPRLGDHRQKTQTTEKMPPRGKSCLRRNNKRENGISLYPRLRTIVVSLHRLQGSFRTSELFRVLQNWVAWLYKL